MDNDSFLPENSLAPNYFTDSSTTIHEKLSPVNVHVGKATDTKDESETKLSSQLSKDSDRKPTPRSSAGPPSPRDSKRRRLDVAEPSPPANNDIFRYLDKESTPKSDQNQTYAGNNNDDYHQETTSHGFQTSQPRPPKDKESLARLTKSGATKFPEKLMLLLSSGFENDSIYWIHGGMSFALVPNLFEKMVLPVYFDGTCKLESFTRKLTRWGFKRLVNVETPGTFAFSHRLFRKDMPILMKGMSGGKKKEQDLTGFYLQQAIKAHQAGQALAMAAVDPTPAAAAGTTNLSTTRGLGNSQAQGTFSGAAAQRVPRLVAGSGVDNLFLEQERLLQEARQKAGEQELRQVVQRLLREKQCEEEERLRQQLRRVQEVQQAVSAVATNTGIVSSLLPQLLSEPSTRSSATGSALNLPVLTGGRLCGLGGLDSSSVLTGRTHVGESLFNQFQEFLRQQQTRERQSQEDSSRRQRDNSPPGRPSTD